MAGINWASEFAKAKKVLVGAPVDATKKFGKDLGQELDMARMQSGMDPHLLYSDLTEEEALALAQKGRKGAERG